MKASSQMKKGFQLLTGALLLVTLCGVPVPHKAFAEEVEFLSELRADFVEPVDVRVKKNGDMVVLDRKLAKVFIFSPDGKLMHSFGEKGDLPGQIGYPVALAISHFDEIIVADQENHCLQVFSDSGEWVYQIGNGGTAPGEFRRIQGLAVDPFGYIYVGDTKNRRITKYSPRGVFLSEQELDYKPYDLTFDVQRNLYVLDKESSRVMKYPDQEAEEEITIRLGDPLEIDVTLAQTIAVDERGDLYLAEWKNHSIVKMDPPRVVLLSFGSEGPGRGQFRKAKNIFVSDADKLYVADTANRRVQIFQLTGQTNETLPALVEASVMLDYDSSLYVGQKISDLKVSSENVLYALAEKQGHIIRFGESKEILSGAVDNEELKLRGPKALYVDAQGKIIIGDSGQHRLQFFNPDGTYQYHFGRKGKDRSEFRDIQGVVSDRQGFIYVADTLNHRIQIFTPDGIYLRAFGKASEELSENNPEPGTFLQPKDLAFNSFDELFVLDYINRRIQVVDKEGHFLREIGGRRSPVRFKDPVDIAIDEQDYLYVADRGDHAVKIFAPEGEFVMEFGSEGIGPSYFPALTALDCREGKIYVADEQLDKIHVYAFDPFALEPQDSVVFARVSQPLKMDNASEEIRVAMAKKLIFAEAKKEVADKLNMPENEAEQYLKVVSEKILADGKIEMILSLPKRLIPLGVEFLGRK